MSSPLEYTDRKELETSYSTARILRILVPTTCDNSTIANINSIMDMFDCSLHITFFHVVPLSTDTLNDCIDTNDIDYAKSVAEKKLYSFVKMMPERENAVYEYKISTGRSKEEISKLVNEGEYDIIALQVGEISHYSHSIFDILELVNISEIPLIIFNQDKYNIGKGLRKEVLGVD